MQMSEPLSRPRLTEYPSLGRRFVEETRTQPASQPASLPPTHPPTQLSRDNCFDLCSEEIRQPVLDVTGWHVTWIQANKRAEGNVSRERFKPSQRAFQMEQWLCPGGKSDPAGMFILDRKEAIIVITGSSLFGCKVFRLLPIVAAIPRPERSVVRAMP